jgi:predicted ATPase with chaperone activity
LDSGADEREERRQEDQAGISGHGSPGRSHARVLRVARTLADLDGQATIGRPHVGEALGYRRGTALPP